MSLFILALAATGAFLGIRTALDRFFFQNPDYTLRRITFELDGILTREEALAETGLQEGVNIFSVDLSKVESALAAIPQVQSVRIHRELPDHLSISITVRRPIAWVAAPGETGDPSASENPMLVDAGGFLMRPRRIFPEYYHLPAIYGARSDNLREGSVFSGEDLRLAIALIVAVSNYPESLLHIRALDISRGYCIEVINDRNTRILFAASNFEEQLSRLQRLLAHCEESGRVLQTVNLMVKRNTPVTFVASAPAPSPVEVAPKALATTPSKTRKN